MEHQKIGSNPKKKEKYVLQSRGMPNELLVEVLVILSFNPSFFMFLTVSRPGVLAEEEF